MQKWQRFIYQKKFEIAVQVNEWTDDEKATALVISISTEEFPLLDRTYGNEIRGQTRTEVHQTQLECHNQLSNESLQEFDTDVEPLVGYPGTPQVFSQ